MDHLLNCIHDDKKKKQKTKKTTLNPAEKKLVTPAC